MDPGESFLIARAAGKHRLISYKHHAILRVIKPLHGRTDIWIQFQVLRTTHMTVWPVERSVSVDEHRTLAAITSGTTDNTAAQMPFCLVEARRRTNVLDVFERDVPL